MTKKLKDKKEKKSKGKAEIWRELINVNPHKVKLSQVYLSPNNPRLQTPGKRKVSDERIPELSVQGHCLDQIRKEGITDLTESIRTSGFWIVDRIVLRPLKDGKYVVIEGNRRVSALKTLKKAHDEGKITLPSKIHEGIIEFEALIYQGKNPDIAWTIQGFRHTPGIKSWKTYPQSMFLAKFEKESKKSASEIASIFGMRTSKVTHLIRSYYGFEDAKKDEDYGDEFSPDKFGHLSEIIFQKESLQTWLEWDDKKRKFKNKKNLKKYLSLAIPEEEGEKPRIDISPSTRETFSEIVKPENKKILEKFDEGKINLEGCKEELIEDKRKSEPIELSGILKKLSYTKKVVETLPIPRLQLTKISEEKEQKEKLIKIMEELGKILKMQIENLTKS